MSEKKVFFVSFSMCLSLSNQFASCKFSAQAKYNGKRHRKHCTHYDGEVRCSTVTTAAAVAVAAQHTRTICYDFISFHPLTATFSECYVCTTNFANNSRIFSPSRCISPVWSLVCSAQWQRMTDNHHFAETECDKLPKPSSLNR